MVIGTAAGEGCYRVAAVAGFSQSGDRVDEDDSVFQPHRRRQRPPAGTVYTASTVRRRRYVARQHFDVLPFSSPHCPP